MGKTLNLTIHLTQGLVQIIDPRPQGRQFRIGTGILDFNRLARAASLQDNIPDLS